MITDTNYQIEQLLKAIRKEGFTFDIAFDVENELRKLRRVVEESFSDQGFFTDSASGLDYNEAIAQEKALKEIRNNALKTKFTFLKNLIGTSNGTRALQEIMNIVAIALDIDFSIKPGLDDQSSEGFIDSCSADFHDNFDPKAK